MKIIACSDLHIGERKPEFRTESFFDDMFKKIEFLKMYQQKTKDSVIICGGDIFDKWKVSTEFLYKLIDIFPSEFYAIYGQHDLPYHNEELLHKSAFGFLQKLGYIKNVKEAEEKTGYSILDYGYGKELPKPKRDVREPSKQIVVVHSLVWDNKEPFPDAVGNNAMQMFHRFARAELLITGDNHQQFIRNYKGHTIINSGGMMRTSRDKIDFEPAFFVYDTETKKTEKVFFPLNKNAFREEAIEFAESKEETISALVESLDTDVDLDLSFDKNLEIYINKNKTKKDVVKKVYEIIERCKNV